MPISTPPEIAKLYGGDPDHFKHVLECLIVPAVKTAGFEPVPPAATGSEIIHASIIKNLSDADMVLCDLSTLNPNVFYELGIRTSLNKPVTLIHDELLTKLPFDTGIINGVGYSSSMLAWNLDRDKLAISDHIKTTADKSAGKNPMWQYFGIPNAASLPPVGQASPTQVLEIVLSKMQDLEKKVQHAAPDASTIAAAIAQHAAQKALDPLHWYTSDEQSDYLSGINKYLHSLRSDDDPLLFPPFSKTHLGKKSLPPAPPPPPKSPKNSPS
ncbi:MAG TPA: hypothetical protein VG734_08530 [Lacunisphaera sp.]|nr:hypothetical protein [Lacunisphaera sp.]